jgi:hypothetical protein
MQRHESDNDWRAQLTKTGDEEGEWESNWLSSEPVMRI